ncbi:5' exonuclease Apollo [Telopea speciosissima]|uniref:5' exonuclease Apollo n=1 Tax=Telopea speciosissima TaxID=54955 RepID=UPI001CC7ED31|nr:5' exonuclease Apollo [Telopea speciosissima]
MPIEMPKGLPFSVDTWSPSSRRKRYHFLTHAHKDHCTGISLYSSYPIYAAHLTKTLILQLFPQVEDSLFVGIEVGESVVIDDPDGPFTVTAFNANHCPGAVMFLFEGHFGNILHTGDCRLTPEYLQNLPEKYIGKKGREPKCPLDYVFLDCTFGKFSLKIPSKNAAIRQVINCIWKHPNVPIVYLACDLLGQEEILVEVSRTFGSKIYVNKDTNAECLQALKLIAPDILSQDVSSRFQVFEGFPKLYERAKAKLMEAQANFQPEPLIIRPSSQWYACEVEHLEVKRQKRKQSFEEAEKDSFGVWHVCYSIHSSQEELEWALQLLQPRRVVSTTPNCRAVELDYVKNHCMGAKVSSDDPIWKLLDINMEAGISFPQAPQKVPIEDCSYFNMVDSGIHVIETNQLQQSNPSTNCAELQLNLSSPSKKPPLTLFGRARLGFQDFRFLHREEKRVPVEFNPPPIVAIERGQESSLDEVGSVEVQCEKIGENEMKVGNNDSHSNIGSSDCLGASLRRLYRSMHVPVPKPLPSLVELMNATKRTKRRIQL